jgi:signal peptidase II
MQTWLKITLFCAITLSLIGFDKIAKDMAKEHLKDKMPISYFYNTVRLEYAENTGVFLSLGTDLPKPVKFWLMCILPLVFLVGLFAWAIKKSNEYSFLKLLPLALIFAGGVGNIKDRILNDMHVTDFLILGVQNLRTGIINLADVYVTIGAIALLFLFRDKKVSTQTTQPNVG